MPRAKKAVMNYDRYVSPTKAGLSARLAHFLDWAAKNAPGQYIAYNVLTKTVHKLDRLPNMESDLVRTVRGNMTSTRAKLVKLYSRDLDSLPGIGVRATCDDADTLSVSLPKKMRRFTAAKRSLKSTVDLIDPRKIPNTPEMKPLKEWLNRSVSEVMKLISSPDFEQKCLPPSSDK